MSNVREAFRPPATSLPPGLPTLKRNRLPLDVYTEPGRFFVTITTEGRRPLFLDPEITGHCADVLRATCDKEGFNLIAYCFMPDHLHLLVSSEEKTDLVRLIHSFKQRTGWWFQNRFAAGGLKASPTLLSPRDRHAVGDLKVSPTSRSRSRPWQKSYYDHVLRHDEDLAHVVRYVLENPVRAGLVQSFDEYPHAWSAHGVPEVA